MNKNFNKRIKGFTLIELLVVISIISLLSSIVLTSLADARENAKVAKVQQDIQQIRNAYELYVSENGNGPSGWPTDDCSGSHLDSAMTTATDVNVFSSDLDDYLSNIPTDPWGNNYHVDTAYTCIQTDGVFRQEGCGTPADSGNKIISAIISPGSGGTTVENTGGDATDDIVIIVCEY